MPLTIGSYTYDVVTGVDLTTEQLVAKPRKTFPFEGNTSVYTFDEDYLVFIDYYEPLKPSQRHPEIANAFFIKDTPISDIGNGVGSFTRTWSTLPGMSEDGRQTAFVRSEYESYVMTVPGITTTQALFQQYPIAGYSVGNGKHTITTTVPHDIAANKPATIFYQVRDPLNKFVYLRQAYRIASSTTTSGSSTLIVDEIKDVNTVQPIGVQRANTNQDSFQKVVTSRIDYTYHLPGVDVATADAIEIIEPFFIIDNATGNRVDSLSDTTTPSLTEYQTKIGTKSWMPVECILRRWQGDILERAVRYCRYQF